MNSDVELLPPAFTSTVFANSNMKCADASLGWLGRLGMMRFLLDLYLYMFQAIKRNGAAGKSWHISVQIAFFPQSPKLWRQLEQAVYRPITGVEAPKETSKNDIKQTEITILPIT